MTVSVPKILFQSFVKIELIDIYQFFCQQCKVVVVWTLVIHYVFFIILNLLSIL